MMSVSGLDDHEAADVAAEFGVALEQVRRDHLISVILSALSAHAEELVFFGGTALARSYLPHGRLSEDIDLIAMGDRPDIAVRLVRTIGRVLRRTHGKVTWSAPLADVRDTAPVILSTDDAINVRVQLLNAQGYPPWPTALTDLHQRYSDAPSARLRVPTRDSFAAWKTVAWTDRGAPRDLYDMWALANIRALTASAAELFAQLGPTLAPPKQWMFSTAPGETEWRDQLAGQTRLTVGSGEALDVVRAAWSDAVGARF